jgi:hypothetical protein
VCSNAQVLLVGDEHEHGPQVIPIGLVVG